MNDDKSNPLEWETPEAAKEKGFETFNNNPHNCIDLPPGNSTVTVRTPSGEKVTFAFLTYSGEAVPQEQKKVNCVDIQHHRKGEENSEQSVIIYGAGSEAFRHNPGRETELSETQIPRLTTLIIED